MICKRILYLVVSILLAVMPVLEAEENPEKAPFPCQVVGNIDRINFNEPSGIVFHPKRGSLFVVGDEGDLCEIRPDGTPIVKSRRIRNADFEGVTYAPSTGLLYVVIERERKILEINPGNFRVLREFFIDGTFRGKTILTNEGAHISAITFVPGPNRREGGTFYVANQSFEPEAKQNPSAIFELKLSLSRCARNRTAKIVRYFSIGAADISGLCYDEAGDRLYAITCAGGAFFECTRDGKILRSYKLPGVSQQGIAKDGKGFFYIAQDRGGILKLKKTGTTL